MVAMNKNHLIITTILLLLLSNIPPCRSSVLASSMEQILIPLKLMYNFISIHTISFLIIIIIISAATLLLVSSPRTMYLVDYALFKPPQSWRIPYTTFVEHANIVLADNPKSLNFQVKILQRSGLGDQTCLPPAMFFIPPRVCPTSAHEEAELVIFSCMDSLFTKTGIKPKDVDILIANCSMFVPSPTLTAMVINKYRMRSNVKSFNLTGMGCSAGLLSIDLARHILKGYPNSNAVVLSTEILSTRNFYLGSERSMLLPNCLFRMGGAAILLSNRRGYRHSAKYKLTHLVRKHKGGDDKSYNCIQQEEDSLGIPGVRLNIDLMAVAANALTSNITSLGPLVLPLSEQLRFALSLIGRKVFRSKSKPYVPDFKTAFEHFCIHAGGRAVIEELQKNLQLTVEQVEASRMALHRFGNTSSSSLWYELSYTECKGRMKRGDRVWQIGVGSGFKCNSAVWTCNRTIEAAAAAKDGPWADCIDMYPVHIQEVIKL